MESVTDGLEQDVETVVAQFRLNNGMCHGCGTSIYNKRQEGEAIFLVPRNVPGCVKLGRCLFCYPEESTGSAFPPTGASGSALAPVKREASEEDDDDGSACGGLHGDVGAAPPAARSLSCQNRRKKRKALATSRGGRPAAQKPAYENDKRKAPPLTAPPAAQNPALENDRMTKVSPQAKSSHSSTAAQKPAPPKSAETIRLTLTIRDADGLFFVGAVNQGTASCGRGTFTHQHKEGGHRGKVSNYDGEYKDGLFHGMGTLRDGRYGTIYSGAFGCGEVHGFGECTWPDGWHYKGEWSHDKREGLGACRQLEEGGQKYEGYWHDDQWHGEGVLSFSEGGRYRGSFKKGKMHGHGKYEFADGSIYKGYFKNDFRHGHGEMMYISGDKYVGNWHQNWRHGAGSLLNADGSVFKGSFRSDEKHGVGYLHLSEGILRKEHWVNGVLFEEAT